MKEFTLKIQETLLRYKMLILQEGQKSASLQTWVVAVSGGPDSVALLNGLNELSLKLKLRLVVAHLNHSLRGAESEEDQKWVETLTEKMGILLYTKKVDTQKMANQCKLGIEEIARKIRYDFFEEVMEKENAFVVATGHTLDDQAETMVLRMVRGAGMDGLGGIPPVNQKGKVRVVRPLIDIRRKEILAYLDEMKVKARLDSSNHDTKFRRNYVRHELLPQIEKDWNPAVKKILARSAELHRDVNDFIEDEIKKLWSRAVRQEKGRITLKGNVLKKVHPFLRQEIVKKTMRRLAPEASERFTFEHVQLAANMLESQFKVQKSNFPDGMIAERVEKNLVISVGSKEPSLLH